VHRHFFRQGRQSREGRRSREARHEGRSGGQEWCCSGRGGRGHGGEHRFHGRHGGRGGRFRFGRMIGDGDLRLIVLALLEKQARHGYDIIKALEEHSSGVYSPSPGIVYPTLTFLEEAGYADAASEGSKRVYTITEAGRAHLDDNREHADAVLDEIARIGRKMARARAWLEDEEQQPNDKRGDRDIPGVVPEINEARRALKTAIAEKLDASADEQRRVASILREAAAAIRKPVEGSSTDDIDLG
jgi:DNA-binding PadR family transcriptional regulator